MKSRRKQETKFACGSFQANSDEDLRVEVAALDQYMVGSAKKLKGLFPDWVDVVAYSSFMSSYVF